MDCRAYAAAATENWLKTNKSLGRRRTSGAHESERDLASMVSEFLETRNYSGSCSSSADSLCSSDSEPNFSDLSHLNDQIKSYEHSMAQYQSHLQLVIHSLIQSISEVDLHATKPGACNASCIRFLLVQLLRRSGYDAAVCSSKWQGHGKVPGGESEYIDVVSHNSENSDRMIVDVDFRSHFEIARAVQSYDNILHSLPVVYVGSLTKLKQFLQVMVEAARISLQQNSMPLPPWRSLAYLQAKWESPYQRQFSLTDEGGRHTNFSDHKSCVMQLKRLHSSLQSDIGPERLLKPIKSDNSARAKVDNLNSDNFRRLKVEKRSYPLLDAF